MELPLEVPECPLRAEAAGLLEYVPVRKALRILVQGSARLSLQASGAHCDGA